MVLSFIFLLHVIIRIFVFSLSLSFFLFLFSALSILRTPFFFHQSLYYLMFSVFHTRCFSAFCIFFSSSSSSYSFSTICSTSSTSSFLAHVLPLSARFTSLRNSFPGNSMQVSYLILNCKTPGRDPGFIALLLEQTNAPLLKLTFFFLC